MATNSSRLDQIASDQQLADGLTQNASKVGTIPSGGKQVPPADVVTVLGQRIAAQKAANATKADHDAALAALESVLAGSRTLVRDTRQTLRQLFAKDPAMLAAMGLAASKPKTPKPATLVAAAAKAKATRAARGTKGKKQKAAIKASAATAPAAEPAAPSAASAPATTTKA